MLWSAGQAAFGQCREHRWHSVTLTRANTLYPVKQKAKQELPMTWEFLSR